MNSRISVRELSQLRCLKREINIERDRVIELRTQADYGRRSIERYEKTNRVSDRTGVYASEIAYLTDLIAKNMTRCICELLKLQLFINDIENSEMRIIFKERYIKGRSWLSIAFLLGYHDEQLPRRKHDRYIQRYNANGKTKVKAAKQNKR
jgi:hypothetical protein